MAGHFEQFSLPEQGYLEGEANRQAVCGSLPHRYSSFRRVLGKIPWACSSFCQREVLLSFRVYRRGNTNSAIQVDFLLHGARGWVLIWGAKSFRVSVSCYLHLKEWKRVQPCKTQDSFYNFLRKFKNNNKKFKGSPDGNIMVFLWVQGMIENNDDLLKKKKKKKFQWILKIKHSWKDVYILRRKSWGSFTVCSQLCYEQTVEDPQTHQGGISI